MPEFSSIAFSRSLSTFTRISCEILTLRLIVIGLSGVSTFTVGVQAAVAASNNAAIPDENSHVRRIYVIAPIAPVSVREASRHPCHFARHPAGSQLIVHLARWFDHCKVRDCALLHAAQPQAQ